MSKHYTWVKISLSICSFVHDSPGYNFRYFSFPLFLQCRQYRQLHSSGNITPATALTSKDTHTPFLWSVLSGAVYQQVPLVILSLELHPAMNQQLTQVSPQAPVPKSVTFCKKDLSTEKVLGESSGSASQNCLSTGRHLKEFSKVPTEVKDPDPFGNTNI